jgi:hypothetical protein
MQYVILVQSLVNNIYTGSTLSINFLVRSCILLSGSLGFPLGTGMSLHVSVLVSYSSGQEMGVLDSHCVQGYHHYVSVCLILYYYLHCGK